MFNFSPWNYKNLVSNEVFFVKCEFYKVNVFDEDIFYEANSFLEDSLRPSWISVSKIYKNSDGTGTAKHKNTAVYKAISEGLERLAFYETADTNPKNFCFDLNPTTTGLAAFPHFLTKYARANAFNEAIERWAIHEFNFNRLPVIKHNSNYTNLNVFEIVTPFKDVKVCLLSYFDNSRYSYAFAAAENLTAAKTRAKIELNRNVAVLKKASENNELILQAALDKTLIFFSSVEGHEKFLSLIRTAPEKIKNQHPKVICDKELVGPWTKYAKVWRYLLEDSYFDTSTDHTFFMF